VARSNIHLLQIMGARVRVVGPPTLMPTDIDKMGVEVHYNMRSGLKDVDIVMMLRLQTERMQGSFVPSISEYFRFFGLDHEKLKFAKPDALIMHPGPMNRGVEIDSEVADDLDRSVITSRSRWASPCAWPASKPDRRPAQRHRSRGVNLFAGTAPLRGAHDHEAPRSGAVPAMSGDILRGAPPHAGLDRLHQCRIIDPTNDREYDGAVLISDGKIADFGPSLFASGAPYGIESVDCRGLYLAPGLVDARVHTASRAKSTRRRWRARASRRQWRITSMVLLPDNEPPFDDASLIEFVARRARQIQAHQHVRLRRPHRRARGQGAGRDGLAGRGRRRRLHRRRPCRGQRPGPARALYYAKGFDALIVHLPQEPTLSGGHMTSGEMATRLGLSGNPPLAEVMLVERDIRLVEMTGGVCTSRRSRRRNRVTVIAAAKARGLKISCDTAPPISR